MDTELQSALGRRLRRVEGQVAGLRRMLDDGADCVDVLIQISAAQGALGRVGALLLGQHIETCVVDAFERGDDQIRRSKVRELMHVFERYSGIRPR